MNVVLDMKKAERPQALLKAAIVRDWKTNTTPKTPRDQERRFREKQRAAEIERKRLAEEWEGRKKAPLSEILAYFKGLPEGPFSFEKRITLTQGQFEGNPLLDQAIEKFRKEEK